LCRFNSGYERKSTDKKMYYKRHRYIYSLAQEVEGWLSSNTNDYASVSDVIQNGTVEDKLALIAIFDNFNNTQWTKPIG
jgi:hypothetical protein